MATAYPTIVLWNDETRERAIAWVRGAEKESRVILKGPKRTLPQNDRLHAMITEVAIQRRHHGFKLSVHDWKRLFVAAWRNDLRMIPNLTGDGLIQVGDRTSELSVSEATDLIAFIEAWAAQNGVVFSDKDAAA